MNLTYRVTGTYNLCPSGSLVDNAPNIASQSPLWYFPRERRRSVIQLLHWDVICPNMSFNHGTWGTESHNLRIPSSVPQEVQSVLCIAESLVWITYQCEPLVSATILPQTKFSSWTLKHNSVALARVPCYTEPSAHATPPPECNKSVFVIVQTRSRGSRLNIVIVAEGACDSKGQHITTDYVKNVSRAQSQTDAEENQKLDQLVEFSGSHGVSTKLQRNQLSACPWVFYHF